MHIKRDFRNTIYTSTPIAMLAFRDISVLSTWSKPQKISTVRCAAITRELSIICHYDRGQLKRLEIRESAFAMWAFNIKIRRALI